MKFQVHCSNNLLLIHWTWWTWYARNDFIISSHNLIISVLFNFYVAFNTTLGNDFTFFSENQGARFHTQCSTNSQNITTHWKQLDVHLQARSNDTNYHEIRYVDIHSQCCLWLHTNIQWQQIMLSSYVNKTVMILCNTRDPKAEGRWTQQCNKHKFILNISCLKMTQNNKIEQ